jgi:plastocyanin
VVFTNKDRVPHNVAFYETKAATKEIFVGEVFSGPKTISYHFTAPSTPGTYFFRCDVHPTTMTGDFVVTDAGS